MINESVQHGCAQKAMPDFEAMKKFMKDDSKVKIREQENIKNRENHAREDNRDPESRKRFVESRLHRRWSRSINLDETYRAPSLFTWRC